MIKLLTVIFSSFFIGNSCGGLKKGTDDRSVIIRKTVLAIANYDTIQLYSLIDTAYCFDIYGKDGFLNKIDFANHRYKVCGNSIVDSLTKTREKQPKIKEYSLAFCRGSKGEVIAGSFDFLFSFSDYDSESKILFIDITNYGKVIQPTKPIKKAGNE